MFLSYSFILLCNKEQYFSLSDANIQKRFDKQK